MQFRQSFENVEWLTFFHSIYDRQCLDVLLRSQEPETKKNIFCIIKITIIMSLLSRTNISVFPRQYILSKQSFMTRQKWKKAESYYCTSTISRYVINVSTYKGMNSFLCPCLTSLVFYTVRTCVVKLVFWVPNPENFVFVLFSRKHKSSQQNPLTVCKTRTYFGQHWTKYW